MTRAALFAAAALTLGACGALTSGTATKESSAGKTDRVVDAADLGLQPDPVAGPFDSLKDYCKLVRKEGRRCGDVAREIETELEAPYEGASVIKVASRAGAVYCEMAVATDAGWFVTEELFICGEPGADVETEILTLELVPQKDTPPIVRAELRIEERDGKTVLTTEEVALCGVGEDGVLCTRPFSRLEHVLHPDGAEEHRAVSMTLSRFGVIKVNGEAMIDGELVDATGAYRIRFE